MCRIITPSVTVFDEDGHIDTDGNRKVIDFLIAGGMDGILVLGSMGEFTNMSLAERKALLSMYVKHTNGRVELYAGTGCLDVAETIELTNYASEVGYQGVFIIGPYYYGLDQERLFEYYNEVAKSVKCNIHLYNYPARSGHSLDADTVKSIVDANPNVIGMKDSVMIPAHSNEIILAMNKSDFQMYSGFDDQFLYNVAAGGSGGICGLSNIVPEIFGSLVSACRKKDFDKTFQLSNLIHRLMPIYSLDSNPSLIIKKLMNHRGVNINEKSIFPFNDISDEKVLYAKKLLD
ncbi:dihydrodipicolinate synthase family protein, partial [Salmonella enterica]|nr:dihydrodipicolinate synthase family protein [Salmonella enterica]